ncbi:hypothetical protein N7G274_000757 [Stereocaulon virgatum]|uniref:Uncharacterized protein n=1 Tax=Stereocaulon virgatum TaxID=373712 RepID=A0ABR4AR49_9LECA
MQRQNLALLYSLPTPQVKKWPRLTSRVLTTDLLLRLRRDRQQPYSTCSSCGQICIYLKDIAKPPPTGTSGLHDRLVRLERLVKSIASKPNSGSNVDFNTLSQPAETPQLDSPIDGSSNRGSVRVSASELQYVGGDHWAAILDSIADLEDRFECEEQLGLAINPEQIQYNTGNADNVNKPASRQSLLLYGGCRPASQAEIFAALPTKGAVDRCISRYFNRQELVSCKCAKLTKLYYDRQSV